MATSWTTQRSSPLETARPVTRRDVLKGMAAAARTAGIAGVLAACSSSARRGTRRRRRPRRRPARPPPTPAPRPRRPPPATSPSAATTRTPSKKGMEAIDTAFTTADRRHGQGQHRRPRHLPEPDQRLPAGHAGRRLHLVLRLPHAVLRRPGPGDRRSTTSGPRSTSNYTDALQDRRRPATTASSTASRSTTTRGRSSTARASSRPRATRSRRRWTTSRPSATKMKTDGLIPIAFGDKDGWPAMGTFDILNLRLNGYDFHVDLWPASRSGPTRRSRTSSRCGPRLMPYSGRGLRGPDLAGACDTLVQKKAGMYLLGLFVSGEFADGRRRPTSPTSTSSRSRRSGTQFDAEKALDAPIDVG